MNSSRFTSATSGLDLNALLRRTRRALWVALWVAVAAHLVVVGVNPFQQTLEKTPRPLTTRFVKREPRLTKPLELRKIPQPRRQMLRRQVRLAAARMDHVQATAAFDTRALIGQAATTRVSLAGEMPVASLYLEPALMSQAVQGTREPANKIDMGLEMLDIRSMDTGRYRAMVVQDPGNPQAIKGFVKIARVSSELKHQGTHAELWQANDSWGYALFIAALKRYTDLNAEFVGHMSLADERLLETPIILPQGSLRWTEQELEHWARYVMAGGFVFGDVPTEALVKYGGLVEGKDFFRERFPDDHPIFTCFFELRDERAHGLWLGDRLVSPGITANEMGYGGGMHVPRQQHWVNAVIYALTQEGSMTQRLMQMME